MKEVEILKMIDHPNVLKFYETFEDETNLYIVTELCHGGDLMDQIEVKKSIAEDQTRTIFKGVLKALKYCHEKGIAHLDVKPENFLLKNDSISSEVKLIDFGQSNKEGKQKMRQNVGTLFYKSPEVLKGDYTLDTDMWSVGCLLYVLLAG